jgi:hypothetical protein
VIVALEYADSFDTYTTAEIVRRYPTVVSSVINTPGVGSVGAYLAVNSTGGGGYFPNSWAIPITVRSEYYIGFDLNCLAIPQSFLTIATAAGGSICVFGILSNGTITSSFGNSSTGIIVAGTWYQVQIYLKRHASAGIVTVKVNGVTVINLTGLNTGATDIGSLILMSVGSNSTYYDNFWVLNTLGSHSNTWPTGRMKVQPLLPTADGTYQVWTPNSGANHYSRVNEAQADDDTTYNSTVTSGNKDSYNIAALGGSLAQIHGVIITAIVRKTDVNSKNYQVFSKSGATETTSADVQAALAYASSTQAGAAALLHTDDPNTSAQWTQANLNNLEIGVKVTL